MGSREPRLFLDTFYPATDSLPCPGGHGVGGSCNCLGPGPPYLASLHSQDGSDNNALEDSTGQQEEEERHPTSSHQPPSPQQR